MIEKLRSLNEDQKKQLAYGIQIAIIVLYFLNILRKENKFYNEVMHKEAEEETRQRSRLKKMMYDKKVKELKRK